MTSKPRKSARRALDFYPTIVPWALGELYKRVAIVGDVAEPCVGNGDLIRNDDRSRVIWTNDVDPAREATYHLDAAAPESWRTFPAVDWHVSNPPFNRALRILSLALPHARVGVAFLLRLTFLEPTKLDGRGDWLEAHPLSRLIVLPRIPFKGGRATDSVTCAWMIWQRDPPLWERPIESVSPRAASLREAQGTLLLAEPDQEI